MKTLILAGLTGLAALTFVAADANADDRNRGVGRQYTINAGSGIVVNDSLINRYRDDNRYDRNRRDDRRRNDYDRRDDRYRNERTSAFLSTGNLSIYWSDGDSRYNRPVYNYGRRDNGLHLGHERREGRYLRDRYGNCFRIDGSPRFERRVKVRSSYCRF